MLFTIAFAIMEFSINYTQKWVISKFWGLALAVITDILGNDITEQNYSLVSFLLFNLFLRINNTWYVPPTDISPHFLDEFVQLKDFPVKNLYNTYTV